jgi:ribonuclease BN (tRNA processing enzyme)
VIKVITLGTGTCIPYQKRRAPANVVMIDDKMFMVDGGSGSLNALAVAGLDYALFDGIFYTHFHPDHIGDLMPLLQALIVDERFNLRTKPFMIYGPLGLQQFVGLLRTLYGIHKKPTGFEIQIKELGDKDTVISLGKGGHVQAFRVPHTDNSIGYRFTSSDGIIVVFSGDTGYGKEVVMLARDADCAFFECSWTDAQYDRATSQNHLSPKKAAQLAHQARVKKLVLTHIYPDVDQVEIKELCAQYFKGDIIIAHDGDCF